MGKWLFWTKLETSEEDCFKNLIQSYMPEHLLKGTTTLKASNQKCKSLLNHAICHKIRCIVRKLKQSETQILTSNKPIIGLAMENVILNN